MSHSPTQLPVHSDSACSASTQVSAVTQQVLSREDFEVSLLSYNFLVPSDVLNYESTADDVANALNDLPTIAPDVVSVVRGDITSGRRFTVTFHSALG